MAQRSTAARERREVAETRARAEPVVGHFEGAWLPVHEYRDVAHRGPGLYGMWLSRHGWEELGLGRPPRTDGGWVSSARRSVP